MTAILTLQIEGEERVSRLMAMAPRAAQQAMRRAIGQVGRQLKPKLARAEAAAHGFPVPPLSKVRTKTQRSSADQARVWFGYNPIRAQYVGRGTAPTTAGVAGAFIATMPSGHTGVFRRLGRARLPIWELDDARLPLPAAVAVAETQALAMGEQAQTVIAEALSQVLLR